MKVERIFDIIISLFDVVGRFIVIVVVTTIIAVRYGHDINLFLQFLLCLSMMSFFVKPYWSK